MLPITVDSERFYGDALLCLSLFVCLLVTQCLDVA